MNCTRYSPVFSLLLFASALGYSQEKIDPLRDIKHNGDAMTYIDGTGHYTVPAGGGSAAANGVVDTTGGTYNTACGRVLDERATGTTTVNLPAVATGCSGVIGRGPSAGVITIAPPSGVSYDGTTTQLPQGQSIGWWYDGTSYHSTRPLIPGSNATYTPSLTGNTLDFAPTGGGGGSYPAAITLTASASSSLNFTSTNACLSSSYRNYALYFDDIVLSADNVTLNVQFSHDGGSTWDTTTSHYLFGQTYTNLNGGDSGQQGNASSAGMPVSGGSIYANTGPKFTAFARYGNPNSTGTQLWVNEAFEAANSASAYYTKQVRASYFGAQTINAMKVLPSSGTITSGTVTCQPLPQ